MREGIRKFLEVIYPSNIYCICCGSIIDKTRPYALCDTCVRIFHWAGEKTCEKCGKLLEEPYPYPLCYECRQTEHFFEKGFCCVQYGLHEKNCVLHFKYGGNAYMGEKLGEILYDRISCEDIDVNLILPVPMYRKKELKRGFNQAALMARALARRMGLPYEGRALLRVRQTAAMSRLSGAERRGNLDGAFAVAENKKEDVSGKRILLIDDILTTGSTADACSRALLDRGAEAVYLLVFAAGANMRKREETESA